MLIRLLRRHLAPYRAWLAAVVALQFVGTVAMLYLPSLNADIIDKGVTVGDTDYICASAAMMLAVSAGADALLGRGRLLRRPHRDGLRARRRAALVRARRHLLQRARSAPSAPPSLITRTTNDVQQVQMLVLMSAHHGGRRADHDGRRHHHGDARGPRPLVAVRRRGAGAVPGRRASWSARWCRASARCSGGSTRSTGSCASRSPASAWFARSSASRSRPTASRRPTPS